jgi:hypothetical protein
MTPDHSRRFPVEWHPAIVVSPSSPQPFEHRDFEQLVLLLVQRTNVPAHQVQIRLGYLYGNGPTDWTVVTFVLDEAGRAAIQAVVEAIIEWGRGWWRKRKKTGAKPIKGVIYGPDGEVLREVEVRDQED